MTLDSVAEKKNRTKNSRRIKMSTIILSKIKSLNEHKINYVGKKH